MKKFRLNHSMLSGVCRGMALSVFFCLLIGLSSSHAAAPEFAITKFNFVTCNTSFPSAYQTVNFAITEGRKDGDHGFTKNQSNKTLILDLPAGYEFNTSVGTVTETGSNITINSLTFNSVTRITVNLSVSATNSTLDVINFNNFQIRATAATSSVKLTRNGGTFKINRKTDQPSATTSWGDLQSEDAYSYSSSTASQAATNPVYGGIADNKILKIAVVMGGNGECAVQTLTQFNFNTDGGNGTGSTNPTTDITTAKVYYTEKSNKFSTKNLFGSFSSPNGAFTINGSQSLDRRGGTYYFWLVYDIPTTATSGNRVDASIVSFVLDGATISGLTVKQPVGSRTIAPDIYYSIATGNWNQTNKWSHTLGGPSCGCAPTLGYGYVYINGNDQITLNEDYTVDQVEIMNSAKLKNSGGKDLTVLDNLITSGSAEFQASGIWTVIGNMILSGTGNSTSSEQINDSAGLFINSGATLTLSAGGLNIGGDLFVDGTLAMGSRNAFMTGAIASIGGTGSITGTGTLEVNTASKLIQSTANLTVYPTFKINGSLTVQNYGSITFKDNVTGTSAAGSIWQNEASSTLNVEKALLSTGTLNATDDNNTVNYSGSTAQNIKATDYFHLQATNATPATSSTKTFQAASVIYGDLTISGLSTLDVSGSNYQLTVRGDFINNSTNATTFNGRSGTVVFDEVSTISGSATTSFYNITASGDLTGHAVDMIIGGSSFVVEGSFAGNGGIVTFNGNTTISGSGAPDFFSIVINSGKTMVAPPSEIYVDGDFTNNGGTFTHSSGQVYFGGTGAQQIKGTSASFTFYDTYLYKTVGTLLSTAGSVATITTNKLDIETGNFTAPATLTINDTLIIESGNTFTAGTTINSNMAWINNGGTFTPGTSTVNFNGTSGDQTIGGTLASQTFYNVVEAKTAGQLLSATGSTTSITTNNFTETTGNFTAPATFTVNGNATLTAGTFTAGTDIYFKGNLTDNGTTFTAGTGTITFNGTGAQTINGTWASPVFYNTVVAKTGGTLLNTGGSVTSLTTQNLSINTGNFTAPTTLNINGDFVLESGSTFTAGATINVGEDWTNNGGTFTYGTSRVYFLGSSAQLISGSAASETFYRLVISNTSGDVSLSMPVNVTNMFTLTSGLLNTTATNILTVGSAATVSGGTTTSYVNGPMTNTVAAASKTISFPVGTGGYYRKVVLNVNHSDATSVTYTTQLVNSSAKALGYSLPGTITLVSGIRYWSVNRQAVANFTNATIELFYNASEDYVVDQTKLNVVQDNGAGAWLDLGQGAVSGTPSITSVSFSNPFHYFTLGNRASGSNPLPISLLNFSVKPDENVAYTQWVTESERNNAYFTLQLSENGKSFSYIGTVDGAGDSYSEKTYQFADETFGDVPSNTVYYRLKQTDFDGTFTISKPLAVKHGKRNITLYPNPGDGLFYLVSGVQITQLMVYDSKGNIVQTLTPDGDPNSKVNTGKKMVIDITEMASGIYLFSAYAGNELIMSGKLVKDKSGSL